MIGFMDADAADVNRLDNVGDVPPVGVHSERRVSSLFTRESRREKWVSGL
jgi:hypothetical protein